MAGVTGVNDRQVRPSNIRVEKGVMAKGLFVAKGVIGNIHDCRCECGV